MQSALKSWEIQHRRRNIPCGKSILKQQTTTNRGIHVALLCIQLVRSKQNSANLNVISQHKPQRSPSLCLLTSLCWSQCNAVPWQRNHGMPAKMLGTPTALRLSPIGPEAQGRVLGLSHKQTADQIPSKGWEDGRFVFANVPGGMNRVARTPFSLTSILWTPGAMYHLSTRVEARGASSLKSPTWWLLYTEKLTSRGLQTLRFVNLARKRKWHSFIITTTAGWICK